MVPGFQAFRAQRISDREYWTSHPAAPTTLPLSAAAAPALEPGCCTLVLAAQQRTQKSESACGLAATAGLEQLNFLLHHMCEASSTARVKE